MKTWPIDPLGLRKDILQDTETKTRALPQCFFFAPRSGPPGPGLPGPPGPLGPGSAGPLASALPARGLHGAADPAPRTGERGVGSGEPKGGLLGSEKGTPKPYFFGGVQREKKRLWEIMITYIYIYIYLGAKREKKRLGEVPRIWELPWKSHFARLVLHHFPLPGTCTHLHRISLANWSKECDN